MRWILRRLGFYVFATWVALTITFLLPRLMPGDPIGGILQHLSPAQIQSNPGIIKTYQTLLGGGHQSLWSAYGQYLHRVVTLNFGISTSNYPSQVSEVVARTLPYSLVLVGIAFMIAFLLGTAIGMIAAWRRGGGIDTIFVPVFMALGAFPAYFTGLLVVYFIGLVFSYPGAGYTLQQAALGNDYPLTQALLLVFALCPIVANFIMDLLNLVLDPRVRT